MLLLITACTPTQSVSLTPTPQFNYTQALIEACQPNDPLFEATYQIQLINQPQNRWYISVVDQKCTVATGSASTPDVTIQMSETDLLQLAQGQIKIDELLKQGRMTVIGEPQVVAHLPHIFDVWASPSAVSTPISSSASTTVPSVTPSPTPITYDLQQWMKTNTDYFNGLFFAEAADLADQLKPHSAIDPPTSEMTFDSSELAKTLATYQDTYRQWQANRYELDTSSRRASFNVITHEVIKQKFEQAEYEIEVITWDAYPQFPVPATLYYPLNKAQKRLPVILSIMGCYTDLDTHNDLNSEQRRGANLALQGFMVFTIGTGLCYNNGLVGEQLANSFAYEQYGRMSGSGYANLSIEYTMLIRALDYLATRPDVDMQRVGVTGYSYGGGLAYLLTIQDPRISALGLVATTTRLNPSLQERPFFDYHRQPTVAAGSPDHLVTAGSAAPLFATLDLTLNLPQMPNPWSKLSAYLLLAPRPFYLVQARDDAGTSITSSQEVINLLAQLYSSLDANFKPPQFTVVEGDHNYNAERRRLIGDWFTQVLQPQPILPPPVDQYEYETPIFPRKVLERRPPQFGQVTLHDIHAAKALAVIEQQRQRQPFSQRSPMEARSFLQGLLKLPDSYEAPDGRPIMVDERNFTLAGVAVGGKFWWLPLTQRLRAAALTITPEQGTVKQVSLYLLEHKIPAEAENHFLVDISARRAVVIVYLPGFGPLRSSQETTGQLGLSMPATMGRTLLGVGVEATQATLNLVQSLYPEATITGYSYGVDAGNILAFTTTLDDRLTQAHLEQAVDTFLDFLTAPTMPIPAPTMAIPGLAAYVDVPDLQTLAGKGRIIIESESDLAEYVLDLRP